MGPRNEKALARAQAQSMANVGQLLESRKAQFAQLLPKHLSADRLIKVALNAIAKNPKLRECSASSLLQCLITCAELGFEPGGALQHAYLVPFKDKERGMLCTLIIGYRGLIDLARRSGQLSQIEAHVVHEADRFEVAFGMEPKLLHVPELHGDPGRPVFAYCIARLKDGGVHVEVMSLRDIEAVQARSKSRDFGPWKTDWEMMARKSTIRRASRYLPMSAELARAIEVDDEDAMTDVTPAAQVNASLLPSDLSIAEDVAEEPEKPTGAQRAREAVRTRAGIVDVPAGVSEEEAEAILAEESSQADAEVPS